jgi:DNA-binding transcriptional LysR family regulator
VIADEPLVAAVSHGHTLAAKATITLTALQEHALISLPPGTGLRTCLDQAAAATGVTPRIAFEASDPRVLAQLAGRGLGVAVLPKSTTTADPALHTIAITRPRLRGRIELALAGAGTDPPGRQSATRTGTHGAAGWVATPSTSRLSSSNWAKPG